jgi:hypothetical protein
MSKKCKECKTPFTPVRPMQSVCGPACAMRVARKVVEKKDKKETKLKLDALQTKPQLVKKAQTAFNAYIRERDKGKNCISCDTQLGSEPNTYDAGHYRSVGSAPHMRFVEDNVHGQCKHCNNWLGGNHVEYRKRLLERIGERQLELLESDSALRKYTKEGLEEIARYYRAEARRLVKERLN